MGDIHVNAAEAVLEKSRPGKKLKIVLIILITLFLIGVICYAGYEIKIELNIKVDRAYDGGCRHTCFYQGIWVDDVHLGGLAVEEAKQILIEKARERLEEIRF